MNNFQIIISVCGAFGLTVFMIGIVLKAPLVTSFGLVVGIFVLVFATSDDLPSIGLVSTKKNCVASTSSKRPNDTDIVTPARLRAEGCMQLQGNISPNNIRILD
ncbi:MAG: hypothetical protein DI537_17435 [Stutzerimonas stutzeri]|nr:MAG: hypothetical protein DI537_17435 [Stutzerimonas stutzeri]